MFLILHCFRLNKNFSRGKAGRFGRRKPSCPSKSTMLLQGTEFFIGILLLLFLCQVAAVRGLTQHETIDNFARNNIEDVLRNAKLPNLEYSARNSDTRRPKKPERLVSENVAHGFEEHEVIVPIRLHHVTGHPVSHGRHFRKRARGDDDHPKKRKRRDVGAREEREHYLRHLFRLSEKNDTNDDNKPFYDVIPNQYTNDYVNDFVEEEDDDLDHRFANFSLDAFGKRFHLHLTPYEGFLAPNYTLQYMGDPKDGAMHPDVPRHCFYSGFVNEREDHRAILSVCRGLFGAFRTDTDDYLIQPEVMSSNPNRAEEDEEGTKPHRIFKRSVDAARKGKQLCGYTDNSDSSKPEFTGLKHDVINGLGDPIGRKSENPTRHLERKRIQKYQLRMHRRKISRLRHLLNFENDPVKTRWVLKKIYKLSKLVTGKHLDPLSLKKPVTSQKERMKSHKKESETLSRKKRYLSYPRNVEVMVTADNAMFASHDDVEHYVLTLMAIVNHVYHDPSVENQINIILVRLVVVGNSQIHNGPRVEKDANSCLRNFCEWQFRENDPDDSHPNHHDTAVLITGQDICRSTSACDTLGLAELGTMCDLRRSCSINEDNGLSTAFTIAHEIGHEFNAPHDNNEKCSDASGRTTALNVMSPTLDNNAHPWTWSKCSARYITSFLDNGNGQCLLDAPPQRVFQLPTEEAGEVFDANDQCGFVYGKGVQQCNIFQETCAQLWCGSQNITHGCRTPRLPLADGTRCGDRRKRMWCQRGQCVPEDRHRVPVDGSWGEWSRFGDCSRTCGGGIKTAIRECNNPKPQYGGRYCTGKRKKFRPCNYQECLEIRDFRAQQCAAFNNWSRHNRHRIRGIPTNAQWIPKYDGILLQDRCKLICQVKRDDQYAAPWYVLKPKVINGTPCGPDTSDICVEGLCKMAGCDHVLNSRTTVDSCGVCNGDNTACRTVQGSYNAGYIIGYNQVIVIPAGANNIVITQTSYTGDPEDNNYLALRDTRGNYILNGNRSVMKSRHRMHRRSAGNRINYLYSCDYSGTDNTIERINCSKATEIDIVVEVLSAGDLMPPNINYRYNVPIKDRVTYRWDPNGPWSPCSSVCNGKTKGKVLCIRSDQQVVPDRKCQHLPKPTTIIRFCNTECQLTWHQKPSECSVRCGTGNINLDFECRKVTNTFNEDGSPDDHVVEVVSDDLCPQPNPSGVGVCQGECLPTSWEYGEWSECSQTCGGGSQTRTSVCRDTRGTELEPSHCESSERVVSRTCSNSPCAQWVASAFSPCMVTCGTGVRHRRVWCSSSGRVRHERDCNIRSKPASTVSCKANDCPQWTYDDWGPCSSSCGEGTSVRQYRCVDYRDRPVDDEECDKALLEADTRPCATGRSCGIWESFGDLSIVWRGLAESGMMQSTRKLVTTTTEKTTTTAPTTTTATTTTTTTTTPTTTTTTTTSVARTEYVPPVHSDPRSGIFGISRRREVAQWRTGAWTQCSATCGKGIRRRYVSCRDHRGDREIAEELCGTPKPLDREECQIQPCYGLWRTSSWSHCSATCGQGSRYRRVLCAYNRRYYDDASHCSQEPKPADTESCEASVPCSTTITIPTTTTSTTSAPNTVDPVVNQPIEDDVVQPRSGISMSFGGDDVTILNRADLEGLDGQWRSGPWSQCSSTCGGGTQRRTVVCQPPRRGMSENCNPRNEPERIRPCNPGLCPRWKYGAWSQCSRSCDGGRRSRRVNCVMSDGRATHDHRCDVMSRPLGVDACNMKPCPGEYRWRKSAWSACSASCGRGLKNRQVTCVDGQKQVVADENCASVRRRKPRSVKRCVKQRRCPRWRVGKWKSCSATCGSGEQHRRISCRYKKKSIVDQLCDTNKRPNDVRSCNVTQCTSYQWEIGPWSTCSKSCGEGVMTRRLTCRSANGDVIADTTTCEQLVSDEPPSVQQTCNNGPCAAAWNVGAWSECSLTCGPGIQRRPVTCSYVDPKTYVEVNVTTCDVTTKPYGVRDCDLGNCNAPVYWRVGSWSECSATCGVGVSERRVVCTDHATQSTLGDAVCQAIPSFRPDRRRNCRSEPCVPKSCRSLQTQHRVTTDGEYFLKMKGKMIKIYCKDMHTSRPSEYVTLVRGSDENFSEIYGYRLINPDTCPMNGTRDENCACHRDYPAEGRTSFEKVRFEIATMRIIASDFSFATTKHGKPVPFGVAGDCYSRNNCPQGTFQINLKGTGLVVSASTRWRSYGNNAVRKTHRSHSGDIVVGTCGGYCSRCQADPITGLRLDLEP
ncbi:unnamed protein product [Clavelina lepadiformis]|uniref:A disintegrin and metalloproteinase with thrombospondin motifs 9 n=1 Tax=Clavelina lepadiformis TaxID=159417 RepID=A0ABP0H3H9_CLALP